MTSSEKETFGHMWFPLCLLIRQAFVVPIKLQGIKLGGVLDQFCLFFFDGEVSLVCRDSVVLIHLLSSITMYRQFLNPIQAS